MKRIGTLALARACVAAFTRERPTAGAAEGSWYVAPRVNALWLDDGRLADDDAGVTLAFGRMLNANWDVEFALFGSEHDRAGNDTLELQGFGVSVKPRVLSRRPCQSVPEPRHRRRPVHPQARPDESLTRALWRAACSSISARPR